MPVAPLSPIEEPASGHETCFDARSPTCSPELRAKPPPVTKDAYKRRLVELQAEIEQAQQCNDSGRAERARQEIEILTDELTAAVGLGGRDRRVGSDAERARVNVTRAIARAIQKIDEFHPDLSRHLTQTIRTGTFCTYAAEPATARTWDL